MKTISGIYGGGQILRTSLTLSMITGQAFRMTHIRAQRRKPGLMRQHLTCVKAAAAICNASLEGAEIGSTELTFHPGTITPGDYVFAIGSAGSTTLLAQTLLPALWHSSSPSTLTLEGGTHNPLAPPGHFLDEIYLGALRKIGLEVTYSLQEYGFAPAGGGRIALQIQPCVALPPLQLLERGTMEAWEMEVITRNLDWSIAERIITATQNVFPHASIRRTMLKGGPGQGVCCLLRGDFSNAKTMFSSFGELGVTAEAMAKRVTHQAKHYLASQAAVSHHLADQLLLPMALHQGGEFSTLKPDEHFLTNRDTIQTFLPETTINMEVRDSQYFVRVSK
jgi:RNA 3'-terminal phosphate cyclase (ATP)